jgi:cell division protein FtsB
MKLPKIFSSKPFMVIALVAVVCVGALEYKQFMERRKIDQEIAGLQTEEQRLTETNKQLEQSISFLSSAEYQDKLARLQLNLKKEGEIVVNFPTEAGQTANPTSEAQEQSNLIKWWEFIFIN